MTGQDSFSEFATENGLRLAASDVAAAPRDVAAPPSELERYTLVTMTSRRADRTPVILLFVSEQSAPHAPSMRDVLWWLAADSWAVEHSGRTIDVWAEIYAYPASDIATLRLFRLHVSQADRLESLLGSDAYRDLLALYRSELDRG